MSNPNITVSQLDIVSRLLTARISRRSIIDVSFFPASLLSPGYDFNKHCGRCLGCLDIRYDGSPCFYLAYREQPEDDINEVFIFYLNKFNNEIQPTEVEALKPYFPNIIDDSRSFRIVNIICPSIHSSEQLAHFLEAIVRFDKLICSDLQVLNIEVPSMYDWNYQSRDYVTKCEDSKSCRYTRSDFSSLSMILAEQNIKLNFYGSHDEVRNPDLTIMPVDGHVIGIIFSEETRTLNYILTHCYQFKNLESYEEVKRKAAQMYDDRFLYHTCTRISPWHHKDCKGAMIQYAWQVLLSMRPHVMKFIHTADLLYLKNDPGFINSRALSAANLRHRRSPNLEYHPDPQQVQESANINMILTVDGPVTYDVTDSQATQVVLEPDWKTELAIWRDVSATRRRIRDSIIPPIHSMFPMSDYGRSYLQFLPSYEEALELMCQVWNRYAHTIVSPIVVTSSDRLLVDPEGAHFAIYPLVGQRSNDMLLIVDRILDDYVLVQHNEYEHELQSSFFNEVTKPYLMSLFPEMIDKTLRRVPITGGFHVEYTRLHLLMSLYVVSRLFKYGLSLPQKIIYGEYEIRKYASNICTELQLINTEYNVDHLLIDSDGYAKEEAMVSFPSPLQWSPYVVPKDQCMFCKRRGFNNLGRHMSMAHGGQASHASRSRL